MIHRCCFLYTRVVFLNELKFLIVLVVLLLPYGLSGPFIRPSDGVSNTSCTRYRTTPLYGFGCDELEL